MGQTDKYSKDQLTLIQLEVVKILPEALQGIPVEHMMRLIEENKLVNILNSAFQSAVSIKKIKPPDQFKYNKIEQKWTLIENVKEQEILPPDQLNLTTPFIDQEKCIFGRELIKRAANTKCNFSQYQAEYLLDHQEQIPMDWRPYCIIFPGTIWADSANRKNVPYIVYKRTGWELSYYWVESPFASASRLLKRK